MDRHPTAIRPQRGRRLGRGSWDREVTKVAQLMMETAAGNRTICRPIGDLDMIGAELLRRAGAGVVTTGGSVVIDLSEVTFIDSAGLCALVGLARRSSECGGSLCFVGARRSVSQVLSTTRIDQLLGMPPKTPDHTSSVRHSSSTCVRQV